MFIRFTRDYQAGNGRMYQGGEVLDVDKVWGNQLIAEGAATLNTSGDAGVVTLSADGKDLVGPGGAFISLGSPKKWVNIATGTAAPRSMLSGAGDTTSTQMMSRSAHHARASVTSVKIVVPNYYAGLASGDLPPGDTTATVKASIEYPAGTYTQLKFSGASVGALQNGGNLVSDEATVSIPDGAQFWVRMYRTGFVAGKMPFINGMNSSLGEFAQYGVSVADYTAGGSAGNTGSAGFKPAAVIAYSSAKSYLLLGDSRTMGTGDNYSSDRMDLGILARSIGSYNAYCNTGTGSDRADWFVSNSVWRRELAQYCTHAVGAYGVNDLGASRTPAQIVTSIQQMRALVPDLPFYQSTIHASTNAGNTAASSYEANRIALNDLIRGGILGITGWVEGADPVESARNSGLFISGTYTSDGLHMTQAGNLALAAGGTLRPQLMP